jgi:hypothetical protein
VHGLALKLRAAAQALKGLDASRLKVSSRLEPPAAPKARSPDIFLVLGKTFVGILTANEGGVDKNLITLSACGRESFFVA